MTASEIIKIIEEDFPLSLQESYDNSGLCSGDTNTEITGILCCIDVTSEVIDEAIDKKANFIISHHPLIFQGIKSVTTKTLTGQLLLKAIKNNIVLYAAHTNIDNLSIGVNHKICSILGLTDCKILLPMADKLSKLVVFVPNSHINNVRQAIFEAGAGVIGKYDCCSFSSDGYGTFRAGEGTNPFAGKPGMVHTEPETRLETILPAWLAPKVVNAIIKAHPYEEVAYDLYPMKNQFTLAGAGMIGDFNTPLKLSSLLSILREKFQAQGIRYTGNTEKNIKKVAVCGGSGSFLIGEAKKQQADVFITGDVKYHQFFEADNSLSIIDIGHYESEQFTKDIFYELLMKKISKFAVHLSEINSNPIKYYS
ncbi:MAG: Nif3-like dinuclear metal center hexameric protein [Bacteroidales bacterium]|nr:Nif3-like dinuclear metal center hexameric protein [Bacteroidales bacterium]